MTDVWFRNADRYMSVMADEGVDRITWTRQHLGRLRMDGIAYVRQFYMHTSIRPKIMCIGVQGSSEYHIFSKLTEPLAVYPTWSGKSDSVEELMRLIKNPVGEDKKLCNDKSVPQSLRPVYGQKHRIVIHNNPSVRSGVGRQFWLMLDRIQRENPEAELFINGSKSYATMFGLRFQAVDFGISDAGDNGMKIPLPSGIRVDFSAPDGLERLVQWKDWVEVLGFNIEDLVHDGYERAAFRVRSARWAAKHYANNFRFHLAHQNLTDDEIDSSDDEYEAPEQKHIVLRRKYYTLKEADKILCSRCRIAPGCRFYRSGAICGLKESEMAELEKYFQSRNADLIVDGLAHIVRLQARRLESAMEEESNGTEIDPEVTKMMKVVFDSGTKLAKLVDPTKAGPGTKVNVNVGVGVNANGSADVITSGNPKEMMAVIVAHLEQAGIPREQITPNMVAGVLQGMANQSQQQAITAEAIKYEDVVKDEKPANRDNIIDVEPEVEKVRVSGSRDL